VSITADIISVKAGKMTINNAAAAAAADAKRERIKMTINNYAAATTDAKRERIKMIIKRESQDENIYNTML
jgi:hypothetical protein